MTDELETIATYWLPGEANIVKGQLEAAGIAAYLVNEEHVAATWLIANAVGGVKLQVAAQDADRARMRLAEMQSVTSDELAVAAADHDRALDESNEPGEGAAEEDEESEPNPREQNAQRAWRAAVMGLVFIPLQLYVFYLLIKIFLADDSLSRRPRRQVWGAALINLPFVVGACFFLRAMMAE